MEDTLLKVRCKMKKRRPPNTISEALDFLIYDICMELGFCLPPKDRARVCAAEFWDADAFTAEVFRLEGRNPDEHLEWKRQIHRRFTEMFGSRKLSAKATIRAVTSNKALQPTPVFAFLLFLSQTPGAPEFIRSVITP